MSLVEQQWFYASRFNSRNFHYISQFLAKIGTRGTTCSIDEYTQSKYTQYNNDYMLFGECHTSFVNLIATRLSRSAMSVCKDRSKQLKETGSRLIATSIVAYRSIREKISCGIIAIKCHRKRRRGSGYIWDCEAISGPRREERFNPTGNPCRLLPAH